MKLKINAENTSDISSNTTSIDKKNILNYIPLKFKKKSKFTAKITYNSNSKYKSSKKKV